MPELQGLLGPEREESDLWQALKLKKFTKNGVLKMGTSIQAPKRSSGGWARKRSSGQATRGKLSAVRGERPSSIRAQA